MIPISSTTRTAQNPAKSLLQTTHIVNLYRTSTCDEVGLKVLPNVPTNRILIEGKHARRDNSTNVFLTAIASVVQPANRF